MAKLQVLLFNLKKDERLSEYLNIKEKYFSQSKNVGLSSQEKLIIKNF